MQITTAASGNTAVFTLSGRFDFNDHRSFKNSYESLLSQPGVTTLEFNMAGIEYIDSSALGMLMLLRERAQSVGKTVVLSHPNTTVSQILDIANFGKLFTIR